MKKKLFLSLVVLVVVAGAGWLVLRQASIKDNNKTTVAASFYPMAEFARQVGGEKVSVTTLTGPGVEPHDYDPRPQDISRLYRSDMFVYNGAGLEHWADRIKDEATRHGVEVVRASDGIELLPSTSDASSPADPHIWLDPVRAQQQVRHIADGLRQVDPDNAAYYQARAQDYIAKLHALDAAFRSGLTECATRDLVTSHQAFGYVAKRYNLNLTSISGLSPDNEPSPQKLAEVAQFVKDNHVRYIFFETLVSPKLADTIARETGAKTLVFNPIEGLTDKEMQQGKNYLSLQEENLQNLRLALNCK